jgi:hypothetical protein
VKQTQDFPVHQHIQASSVAYIASFSGGLTVKAWYWLHIFILCQVLECIVSSIALAGDKTKQAARSTEIPVNLYQTTWHHSLQDRSRHSHHHEDLQSRYISSAWADVFGRTVLPHQAVIICTDCGLCKLHISLYLFVLRKCWQLLLIICSLWCYTFVSVWKYTGACEQSYRVQCQCIHHRVVRWILIGKCVHFISVLPALVSHGGNYCSRFCRCCWWCADWGRCTH